ncbi:MAG: Deoxynucleoside kinase [Parcubacteria group bacterium Gr01-1014_18]|nr:MAG: Deoxynucleoside kinase [Parcubacteria group bacterium Greene0416_36]TSC79523.1 MAG: Deoxynucleoside kinase [Parcubacteria group bacterium Gr01-1014_18]TSC97989.1 MAG: Deoxynucleoside kinase [Parcubacteria group bacterium Greene1014_20]TSD06137.1 MAG: Deoxynucleoside kinase [Parcubacteria group bacterium Greene0714_2]
MIVIEGIIGAGKTTFSHGLHKKIARSTLYLEPVNSNPYLDKFYKDPARWGLEMQYFLMAKRFQMHVEGIYKEWSEGTTTIFDRSIYGDRAFAEVLHDDGFIDDMGYQSYLQHRQCMEKQLLKPQLVIHLNVGIETAIERVRQRGRECESGISGTYLKSLNNAYLKILGELQKDTTVETIPWDQDRTEDEIQFEVSAICKRHASKFIRHEGLSHPKTQPTQQSAPRQMVAT